MLNACDSTRAWRLSLIPSVSQIYWCLLQLFKAVKFSRSWVLVLGFTIHATKFKHSPSALIMLSICAGVEMKGGAS